MAKSLFRALVALSFLAPLWLNAAPRVITLSPANTELAFAAGITPVGVSSYSDYPPQAQKIEQVSTWQGMNLERIVALKPDLVIAWRGGNAERQVDQLASLGIKVMWVDATSIEQIANALRQLAPWSPQPDKAEQAAQSLLDQYAQLKAQYADKPKKRVFLQFGINPPFTSGKESIQNQVLEVCGGENIFKDSRVPWPQVSREQVLARHRRLSLQADRTKFLKSNNTGVNSSKFPLFLSRVTGLNVQAHVLSSLHNSSVMRFHR